MKTLIALLFALGLAAQDKPALVIPDALQIKHLVGRVALAEAAAQYAAAQQAISAAEAEMRKICSSELALAPDRTVVCSVPASPNKEKK
tara:strand:+ start:3736 stop:4002 length:267 start_codon:yes stop_codon:yes gene_type:complete